MKKSLLFLVGGLVLIVSGCDSMSKPIPDQKSGPKQILKPDEKSGNVQLHIDLNK